MKNILLTVLIGASTLCAQNSTLKGNFFFEESGETQTGQKFHSIATLAFDGQGQLQGTQYVKGIGLAAQFNVRGNYDVTGNGGTLVLERMVPDPDADGGMRFEAAAYQLLKTAAGGYEALRTNYGVLADGSLLPLANAAPLKGEFAVVERGVDVMNQSYATLGTWTLDGNGNVVATTVSRSFGELTTNILSGRMSPQADGSFDVMLNGAAADDGTPGPMANYKLIPNGKGFDLMRVDSGIVAETNVSAR